MDPLQIAGREPNLHARHACVQPLGLTAYAFSPHPPLLNLGEGASASGLAVSLRVQWNKNGGAANPPPASLHHDGSRRLSGTKPARKESNGGLFITKPTRRHISKLSITDPSRARPARRKRKKNREEPSTCCSSSLGPPHSVPPLESEMDQHRTKIEPIVLFPPYTAPCPGTRVQSHHPPHVWVEGSKGTAHSRRSDRRDMNTRPA